MELVSFFDSKNGATLVRTALAAGTVGQLALVAVRALGGAGGGQSIVGAAECSAPFGVAPFRIRHCSFLSIATASKYRQQKKRRKAKRSTLLFYPVGQVRERIPAAIRGSSITGAGLLVQILAAARAKSFAVRLTENAIREGQQHLLPQHVFQQQTTLFIIPDFSVIGRNGVLPGDGIGVCGAEDEVKLLVEGLLDGFDAAGAGGLKDADVPGAEADVVDDLFGAAVLGDEVGLAFDGQGAFLVDDLAEVDGSGGEGLVDPEGFIKKLEGGDKHGFYPIFP
jgi:hypothetical protein